MSNTGLAGEIWPASRYIVSSGIFPFSSQFGHTLGLVNADPKRQLANHSSPHAMYFGTAMLFLVQAQIKLLITIGRLHIGVLMW